MGSTLKREKFLKSIRGFMGSEERKRARESQKEEARESQTGQRVPEAREGQKEPEKARKSQKRPERAKFHPIFPQKFFLETRVFFPLRFFRKGEERECQKEHKKARECQEGRESAREEREKARKSQKRQERARGQREPDRRAECPKNGP